MLTQQLLKVVGIRWTIEQSFEESKGEVGLGHYEVRSFTGWYKHITLACYAHTLLAVLRNQAQNDDDFKSDIEIDTTKGLSDFKKGPVSLIPVSKAEIKRFFTYLIHSGIVNIS